jgi:hypothetical protein
MLNRESSWEVEEVDKPVILFFKEADDNKLRQEFLGLGKRRRIKQKQTLVAEHVETRQIAK